MHIPTVSLNRGLTTLAQRAFQDGVLALDRLYHRWLRLRRMQATARALRRLDDRALRDIGLGRSELLSAGAELHGVRRDRRASLLRR
jgi:uncharacterized protein YjiS (DUF1127 family)